VCGERDLLIQTRIFSEPRLQPPQWGVLFQRVSQSGGQRCREQQHPGQENQRLAAGAGGKAGGVAEQEGKVGSGRGSGKGEIWQRFSRPGARCGGRGVRVTGSRLQAVPFVSVHTDVSFG
jgi:hypothetical protein